MDRENDSLSSKNFEKQKYFFTVLIPTYNRSAYLDKCLNSIVTDIAMNGLHEFINIEVRDNDSIDDTFEIVAKYKNLYPLIDISYFKNDKNIGGINNFIELLKNCTSTFSMILGDDNIFINNGLFIVYETLKNNQDCQVFHFRFKGSRFLELNSPLQKMNINDSANKYFYNIGNAGSFALSQRNIKSIIEKNIKSIKSTSWPQTEIMYRSMFESGNKLPFLAVGYEIAMDIGHLENVKYNSVYITETMFLSLVRVAHIISKSYDSKFYHNAVKSIYAIKYWKKILPMYITHNIVLDNPTERRDTKDLLFENFKFIQLPLYTLYSVYLTIAIMPLKVKRYLYYAILFLIKILNQAYYDRFKLYISEHNQK